MTLSRQGNRRSRFTKGYFCCNADREGKIFVTSFFCDAQICVTSFIKCWFLFQGTAVLASPLNGQFYVIGNPSEVLGGSRTLAPRFSLDSSTSASAVNSNPRHDRRRATHNEVERRRRDNINAWIMKLGRLIPPGDAWHSTLNIQWGSEIHYYYFFLVSCMKVPL